MAEYFYHLLPVHHFLNMGVDDTDIFLLFYKVFSAESRQLLCDEQHECHHDKRCERERDI